MCHSHANNNKINKLYERCLRIVYNDKQFSFNQLLKKDGSVSIHMRNMQVLATEMYKFIINLSPPLMNRVFKLNSESRYNLTQISKFSRSLVRSRDIDILPDDYKTMQNLDTLNFKIKKMETRKLSV